VRARVCVCVFVQACTQARAAHHCNKPTRRRPTAGSKAPRPLKLRQDDVPAEFKGEQLSQVLKAEGATYNWLWQVVRNM